MIVLTGQLVPEGIAVDQHTTFSQNVRKQGRSSLSLVKTDHMYRLAEGIAQTHSQTRKRELLAAAVDYQ